jgi:type II secretory pathway pseudopilin PulG
VQAPPSQYGPPPPGYPPHYPPPPPPQHNSNKTVIGIVIGIVAACVLIPIIGIIATITIPLVLSARNNAVSEKARNSLRAVVSAEAAYYQQERRYGSLDELVQDSFLDASFATGDLGQSISISLSLDEAQAGYYAEAHTPTATYSADESGEIQME